MFKTTLAEYINVEGITKCIKEICDTCVKCQRGKSSVYKTGRIKFWRKYLIYTNIPRLILKDLSKQNIYKINTT